MASEGQQSTSSELKRSYGITEVHREVYTGGPIALDRDLNHLFCPAGENLNVLNLDTGRVIQVIKGVRNDLIIDNFVLFYLTHLKSAIRSTPFFFYSKFTDSALVRRCARHSSGMQSQERSARRRLRHWSRASLYTPRRDVDAETRVARRSAGEWQYECPHPDLVAGD